MAPQHAGLGAKGVARGFAVGVGGGTGRGRRQGSEPERWAGGVLIGSMCGRLTERGLICECEGRTSAKEGKHILGVGVEKDEVNGIAWCSIERRCNGKWGSGFAVEQARWAFWKF